MGQKMWGLILTRKQNSWNLHTLSDEALVYSQRGSKVNKPLGLSTQQILTICVLLQR